MKLYSAECRLKTMAANYVKHSLFRKTEKLDSINIESIRMYTVAFRIGTKIPL